MINFKKILSATMAVTMVASMSIVALADTLPKTAVRVEVNNSYNENLIEPKGGSVFSTEVLANYGNEIRTTGFLTNSWAHCDGYSNERTKSVSLSFTGTLTKLFADRASAELGLTGELASSVTQHIPADPSRYSKLVQYTEYTHQYVRVTQNYIDTGSEIVKEGDLYTPFDSYIDVIYK